MSILKRWVPSALVLAGLFTATGVAVAALVSEVKDEAGFFSAEAIKKANREIKNIKDQFKHDLVVETLKAIPEDRKAEFEKLGKTRFFDQWARDRAKALEVNGVYVLITKEPAHLEVEVGNETRKKTFTLDDRKKLVELLLEKFKAKKYDDGLLDGIAYVHDTMKGNLKQAALTPVAPAVETTQEQPHTNEQPQQKRGLLMGGIGQNLGGLLCIGLVAVVVIWAVIGLVRALTGSWRGGGGYGPGGAGPGYGGGYGGGGGGFFSSLVGGMFGAAAGMWMYNSFFGGGSHGGGFGGSAYGGGADTGTGASQPAEDTDYSGSGGDYGDSGGGGGDDAGGGGGDFGDSGGGDSGGGDFGGGGGDFGGGGGDFGGGGGDFGGGGGGGDFGGGGGDF